jgi:hypothetical protein
MSLAREISLKEQKNKCYYQSFILFVREQRERIQSKKSSLLTHNIMADCPTFQISGDAGGLVHLLFHLITR